MSLNLTANSYKLKASSGGYVALLTVLIVGAVVVTLVTTLLLLGVDNEKNVLARNFSMRARHMADACGEEALEQIKESKNFSGYGTLTYGDYTCGYNISSLGGTNRLITASSTVDVSVRKIRIFLDKVNPVNITSWQEVFN